MTCGWGTHQSHGKRVWRGVDDSPQQGWLRRLRSMTHRPPLSPAALATASVNSTVCDTAPPLPDSRLRTLAPPRDDPPPPPPKLPDVTVMVSSPLEPAADPEPLPVPPRKLPPRLTARHCCAWEQRPTEKHLRRIESR